MEATVTADFAVSASYARIPQRLPSESWASHVNRLYIAELELYMPTNLDTIIQQKIYNARYESVVYYKPVAGQIAVDFSWGTPVVRALMNQCTAIVNSEMRQWRRISLIYRREERSR